MSQISTREARSNVPRGEDVVDVVDGDEGAEIDPLPLSEVFAILSNARRRRVLEVLRDCGGSSTLSEVAEEIAAWENGKDVSELTSSERKRTYVGLYQCHLPKMDDSGVVEFDKHRGDIRLGPRSPRLFEYIDSEPSRTRPWAKYYLSLAGVWGGVFLAGQIAGIAILVSPAVIGLQLFTFLFCSVLHFRDTRDTDRSGRSLRSIVELGSESI